MPMPKAAEPAPTAVPAPRRVAVKVKICGVTDPASAAACAELGADFLGLNFCPASPRYLADSGLAREIAAAARAAAPGVLLVGVFVNPAAAEIAAAAAAAGGLDLLQFSGDEPPAAVRAHAARAIKALRLAPPPVPAPAAPAAGPFAGYEECWAWLFDTPRTGAGDLYGGTGVAWDYEIAAGVLTQTARRRVFLAGGLGPGNVRQVVAALRPFAVDVCSGVESAPGRKDPRLLRQLFEEVRNGQAPTAA
jgi:phosphoribosylanthranilate isomerase